MSVFEQRGVFLAQKTALIEALLYSKMYSLKSNNQRWTEGRSLRPKAEGFTSTATATVAEGLGP